MEAEFDEIEDAPRLFIGGHRGWPFNCSYAHGWCACAGLTRVGGRAAYASSSASEFLIRSVGF